MIIKLKELPNPLMLFNNLLLVNEIRIINFLNKITINQFTKIPSSNFVPPSEHKRVL